MRNSYLIIGTGAIGAYVGSLLHRSERAVVFHCRSNYEFIQRDGLTISDQQHSWTSYSLLLSNDLSKALPCSVGLLCTKSYENDNLLRSLSRTNYPKIIICMQNGIGMEEKILRYLPDVTIISAICFVKVTPRSKNHFHHDFGNTIALAQYDPTTKQYLEKTGILSAVTADFVRAGVTAHPKKFKDVLWTKLALNVPLCLLSIIHNQSTTALARDTHYRSRFYELLHEIEKIAKSEGAEIDVPFIMTDLKRFASTGTEVFHSMKADFDHNRPIEFESMFYNVFKIARRNNISTPLLDDAIGRVKKLFLSKSSDESSISALIKTRQTKCANDKNSDEKIRVPFLRSSL